MTKILHRHPDRRCKKIEEWPAADRDLWQAALLPGDLLEEGGHRATYAQVSNDKIVKGYGRWLTWLDRRKLLDPDDPPADRITPVRVHEYIADLEKNNASRTLLARLQELREAAMVMAPSGDWAWINRIASSVRARHKPARPKRLRLVGAGKLFDLGLELMAGAPKENTMRRCATTYRDGLLVAVLAARPLRLRNLAGLVLDRTLVSLTDGWWIQIPATATKTKDPIELPWPDVLVPALKTYLSQHRPILAAMRGRWSRPPGGALWLSTDGSPMTRIAIYDRIIARTREGLDRPVNPHLFRDCAATSIAIEDPFHVRVATRLLGHRTAATTERYYNQAHSIEAARRHQELMVGIRNGTIKLDRDEEDHS